MAHNRRTSQFSEDGLRLISFCPLCETHYKPLEARVVGERDNSHLVHITCKKCSNAIIALILVSPAGLSSIGLVTDLTFDDALKFREAESLDTDDVLEAHCLLQNERTWWFRLQAQKVEKWLY